MFIDIRPIFVYLRDGRARHQSALRSAVSLSCLHVIRVEQERVFGIQGRIARDMGRQHKRFEEPTGVGQMSLRRAHGGHAAHDVIFRLQWRTKVPSCRTYRAISLTQCSRRMVQGRNR